MLFAPGTTAAMRFADGSTQPRPGPWTVRQTEYTVGGPGAMPGELPATSEYTYAVELAIDEAQAAGATSVEFTAAGPGTHAAVEYVENFIGAPVGSGVPSGSYDRAEAEWEPEATGRVVKVVSETAGRADLDTDGDGDSDGADYPAALKITDGERAALAPLYEPGAELWRVPIRHFSEWDFNWGGGLPAGGRLPRLGPDGLPLPPGCPQPASSTIDCEDQRLREELPVPGTPYSLSYSSDWEPSPADRRMTVPLIEGSVPDGLILVRLQATVAGRTFVRRFAGDRIPGQRQPAAGDARPRDDDRLGRARRRRRPRPDRQGPPHPLLLLRGRLRGRRSGRHVRGLRQGRGVGVPRAHRRPATSRPRASPSSRPA